MSDKKIKDLLPALIEKTDKSYVAVEELGQVLQATLSPDSRKIPAGRRIKNIAITGPYGAGKSSIIQTLENDYPSFEYLNLSLATLRTDKATHASNEHEENQNVDTDISEDNIPSPDNDADQIGALNRRIEYSILQQIIYKEESSQVPNSRLRRIRHFKKEELVKYGISIIVFLLCFFIVFEPTWFRVETFYSKFDFGQANFWIDLICAIIMIAESYLFIKKLIQAYSNSKLNKLNLKDGEIEIEETSIFNKHLDEILYFFQVTKYNVVVIEDLDRFGTTDIFLKLRELNQLINESKVIDRPVVFLYAVKDDLFIDEDRVKFFDYIVTVVPTINPSNSKDRLKDLLAQKGHTNFNDDDLSEMGFFIQDMRLLINIVNEYDQYHLRLIKENANLDCTKLLGMIVYKNFFPRDFAKLHRREGMVYKLLQLKDTFIDFAQTDIIKREKNIDDLLDFSKKDSHLKIQELRRFFMDDICRQIGNTVYTITLGSNKHTPYNIINNDDLFNSFVRLKEIAYHQSSGYYSNASADIDVQERYSSTGFEKRIKALELNQDPARYAAIKQTLYSEKLGVSSLKIKELFENYALDGIKEYKNLYIPDLIDIFIRRGYIDEDYYDYISYFYEGMISMSDRETLIDIKRQRRGDYLKHIDHIENFVKELKPYNFTSDSILYVELLDHLVSTSSDSSKDYLTLFYKRLNRKTAPLKFLALYYLKGKYQEDVFSQFIANNPQSTWQQVIKHPEDSERKSLLCAWLRFAKYPVLKGALEWINQNYSFIANNAGELSPSVVEKICEDAIFEELLPGNQLVLKNVTDYNSYVITSHNLAVIIAYLKNVELDEEKISLTEIWSTQNDTFIENIQTNIKASIGAFSNANHNESVDALKWLINNDEIEEEILDNYLNGQNNLLPNLTDIKQERWCLVLKNFLVDPSWATLQEYYNINGFDNVILGYIEKFAESLGKQLFGSDGNTESVFFGEIFKSQKLSINTIKQITPVFLDNSFDGNTELANLDEDRLDWLLEHDMLLFTDGNSSVLNSTKIFIKYLIKYKDEFLESLSESYLINPEVTISLFDNVTFTNEERSLIINNIPDTILRNESVARRIIKHVVQYGEINKAPSYYISLLESTSINEYSIRLAAKILNIDEIDISVCNDVLSALGSPYSELIDTSKNPKFEASPHNTSLLESAIKKGIIISYKPYKDNLVRAYHSRK